MVLCDFNARVQKQMSEHEHMIGAHTFDPDTVRLADQSQSVVDNRENFLTYANRTAQVVMNTCFKKRPEKLITYKEDKSSAGGAPFTRGKYEVLDYVLVPSRWKKAILNVESDIYANLKHHTVIYVHQNVQ